MRRRKNFLPTLVLTLILTVLVSYIILKIPPSSSAIVYCLLLMVYCLLFLIFSLLLGKTRWGFLFATGIIVFLFLRFLKIANLLTILLLISSLITLEIYFRR